MTGGQEEKSVIELGPGGEKEEVAGGPVCTWERAVYLWVDSQLWWLKHRWGMILQRDTGASF
jgi:hypothetical protein